jgi:carboxymethylenebutenolidase
VCFEFDARPPELPADLVRPPMAGGAAAEILELTSADGTHFSAALAESPQSQGVGVVILPDVRGLYAFYTELAERFAQAGHHAIVIDYFGRTAGLGPRGEDFDFWPEVRQTTVPQVQIDTAAAIDALRERTGVTSVVTVGFCFGGMQSFLASTNRELGLDGVVGFYAGLATMERFGFPGPLERADEIAGPLLGLFGGADQGIPVERVHELDVKLSEAGVEHEIEIYPGAPHSFFDRKQDEFADACADAWRRVLGFLESVGAKTAA